jgi:pseudouridine synthase
MRLNKFLAEAGIASRRQADHMIQEGRVLVNNRVVTEMGVQIDPETDHVTIDEQPVVLQTEWEYLILNKPPGFLTTVSDPFGRPTVMELLPPGNTRLYPVGRLDLDTSGLLFFTNDGELALALTHPRHLVEKVYRVKVRGVPDEPKFQNLASGVLLGDGLTAPAKVALESIESGNAILRITIREGRKRQIKRMMLAIGHPVVNLHRIVVGPLKLGDLKLGEYRRPTKNEMEELNQLKLQVKEQPK